MLSEIKNEKYRNVSFEALTVAKQLARGGEIIWRKIWYRSNRFVEEIKKYGPNKVYMVEDEALNVYTMDAYTQALCQLIEEIQAEIILMGHTSIGKDLTPRVAARFGAGLASDCIGADSGEWRHRLYSSHLCRESFPKEGI